MGSAALYQLAARGSRVIGMDALDPPHVVGSTHGQSRIIREAYFEHPSYVPLVRRAYDNWAMLERESGVTLFRRTGGLMIGTPDSGLIQGTRASAALHSIAVEELSSSDIRRRFPAFAPTPSMVGVLEQRAGVLFPEECVRAFLAGARNNGADIRTGALVTGLRQERDGAITALVAGDEITARRVVITAGAWSAGLLAMLDVSAPLEVERQTMHWLESTGDPIPLTPGRMPIMMVEHEPGRYFYSIPDLGEGVKAAIHYEGAITTAGSVDRDIGPADTQPVLDLIDRFIPAAAGRIRESAVCLYTKTPDLDFIIGPMDEAPNVILVSACSGHGFKFASALGEVAAQMALGENVDLDVSQFTVGRFS